MDTMMNDPACNHYQHHHHHHHPSASIATDESSNSRKRKEREEQEQEESFPSSSALLGHHHHPARKVSVVELSSVGVVGEEREGAMAHQQREMTTHTQLQEEQDAKRIYEIVYKELRSEDKEHIVEALRELDSLCAKGPIEVRRSNKKVVRHVGARTLILHLLAKHKDCPSVQIHGIGALFTLLIGDKGLKEELTKAYAVQTVVDGMLSFPQNENLQETAIAFFFPFCRKQFIEQGGMKGISSAMRAHPGNEHILHLGCQLLSNTKGLPGGKRAIFEAGCLSVLAGIVEKDLVEENTKVLVKNTLKELLDC